MYPWTRFIPTPTPTETLAHTHEQTKKGFDTVSRETSAGPSVFTSGLVKIGVGLSHNQFGSRFESTTWNDLVGGSVGLRLLGGWWMVDVWTDQCVCAHRNRSTDAVGAPPMLTPRPMITP